jgi:ATP-dependent exoDNAse (exonuclease V) beta subunit
MPDRRRERSRLERGISFTVIAHEARTDYNLVNPVTKTTLAMIEQLHASAGSGKTYRLTRRFLRLLMGSGGPAPACGPVPGQGYGPESILAITFTNKAAAEMKERVLLALKSLALGLPDPEFGDREGRAKAGAWLERTLRHYQTLNIRTIDSLLNHLARLFALELGLPPTFETSLDAGQVFDDLHDAVTGRLSAGDVRLEALVARVAAALILIEGQTGFWLAEKARDRLENVFEHLLQTGPPGPRDVDAMHAESAALRESLVQSALALAGAMATAGVKPVANFTRFLAALGGITSLKGLPESAYAHMADLTECVLSNTRGLVTPSLESLYQALRAAYLQARARGPLLSRALALEPFLEFGELLLDAFERYKRDRGLALLAQLPASVAGLMRESGGVSEAFCRMGSRLNHLLIDEFQDTSASQWEVLSQLAAECLSKGGSLFYVGDVKQAIYGWRGGDAALFEAAARDPELSPICPEPKREVLDSNWRSAPEIVAFNNRIFSRLADEDTARRVSLALMPDEAPEAEREALAASLVRAFTGTAQQLPPGREDPGGFVSIGRLPGQTRAEYDESAREALAALFTNDLLIRREPSDIALLTRSNAEAAKAAQWLVELGVPVVTENSLRLAEHPIVRGAVSFLAFLDYPPDSMALWGFLSCRELFGRARNIAQKTLSDWLAAKPKGPLYRHFRRDFQGDWNALVEPFLKGAGPASPYDLVQELFDACQVFAAYPGDEVFLRRFLELVHNAQAQGAGSLSAFLEFWRDKGREEKIPQPEDARAVRVLTIHKSKGLEFPVVVAPFHLFPAHAPDGFAKLPGEGGPAIVPLCKELGAPYFEHAAKTLLEQVNMLYVAWTRPERELHVFLPGEQKLVNSTPLAKALDLLLADAGVPAGEACVTFGQLPPSQAELAPRPPKPIQAEEPGPPASPLEAQSPLHWLPGLKIARRELGDPAERLTLSDRARGVALHKAMELYNTGDDPLPTARKALTACGVAVEDAESGIAESLEWLRSLDFFPALASIGAREPELMDEDGKVHRPDLLAFTAQGPLILDYKTGREDPAHHDQVRRYMRLAAALPQADGLPARGLLAYVDVKVIREVSSGVGP